MTTPRSIDNDTKKKKKHGKKDDDTDRFSTDNKPQFRAAAAIPKESKVVLDERFASVLTDPKYSLDVVRDKYGRKQKKKSSKKKKKRGSNQENELSAFYSVERKDDGIKDNDDDDDGDKISKANNNTPDDDDDTTGDEPRNRRDEKEDEPERDSDMDPSSRIAYLTALSRGELDVSSSSSEEEDDDDEEQSDDDDDEDDENSSNVVGKVGILDPSYNQQQEGDSEEDENELTFEPSRHLAVLNMDWSNIRATDIYAVVASFTPPGAVEKVQVFPSDFGMEQMAKEEQYGPSNVWRKEKSDNKSKGLKGDDDDDSASETEDSDSDATMDEKQRKSGPKDAGDDDEDQTDLDDDASEEDHSDYPLENFLPKEDHVESDFDPEKLREYEVSRLKYYFAVVYFTSEEHADTAYKEVDGLEFENSSSAIDVRAIPPGELDNAIQNRPIRDQATSIPSNYVPPDFILNALQQTNVKCTWESGDADRDRLLTKYSSSGQDWKEMAETDDLKAYLASDASSDEEENDDDEKGKKAKASKMRKLLGLDGSDDDQDDENSQSSSDDDGSDDEVEKDTHKRESIALPLQESDSEQSDADEGAMEARFIPGAKDLSEKIRSKMQQKSSGGLSPWEKYQQKRKEKRRERKQEAREKREEINKVRRGQRSARDSDEESDSPEPSRQDGGDSFFLEEPTTKSKGTTTSDRTADRPSKSRKPIGVEELELLVAGDDKDESKRDYDMRGLQRLDRNKDKKLRGARKRKEAQIAESVSGMTDFQMNLKDDRFKALMDGQDARFGIDRTDPNYKDTPAMREVLSEQGRRRRRNKKRKTSNKSEVAKVVPKDAVAGGDPSKTSQGASALSALVNRLKAKVS